MVEVVKISVGGEFKEIYRVTLNRNEFDWAVYAGVLRHHDAVSRGNRRADGTKATYDEDILGAIGEFVVSLALRVPWRGPGSIGTEDLVGGFEVRTTSHQNGRLIIKKKDRDDMPVILVTGTDQLLVWNVNGWIFAKEGKQEMFLDNPCNLLPRYFVDKDFLHELGELKIWLDG